MNLKNKNFIWKHNLNNKLKIIKLEKTLNRSNKVNL